MTLRFLGMRGFVADTVANVSSVYEALTGVRLTVDAWTIGTYTPVSDAGSTRGQAPASKLFSTAQ